MKRDMIYKDLIQLDMEAADTDDFFDKMAAKLEELGFVKSSFVDAIKTREKNFPTALEVEPYPVAIPHADPEHSLQPFIAPVRFKEPVKWWEMAANDVEHDVKFVFMLGFKRSDEHVELLQILVANFQDESLMKRLMDAKTEEEYMEAILSMKGL